MLKDYLSCFFISFICISVNQPLVDATKCRGNGNECEKFHCSSDSFLQRPIDPYLRNGETFKSPCSCLPDWNSLFCQHTQALLTSPTSRRLEHPTVCICRKFDDNNSKCQQFITRCFYRKDQQCNCCFNQPSNHCNHIKCVNGEPDFGGSNTSCICHHNPADYPYGICSKSNFRMSSVHLATDKKNSKTATVKLLGTKVSSSLIWYCLLSLLIVVSLLTIVMLIAGNRKLRKRRTENNQQLQAAQEALLMQRADDERFLPTV